MYLLTETSGSDGSLATRPRYQREARLRPEAAGRYPWIWPGEWQPAAILADRVLAGLLLRGGYALVWNRVLDQDHFEFRGGGAAGGERAVIRA
jgi:hypothetical protein